MNKRGLPALRFHIKIRTVWFGGSFVMDVASSSWGQNYQRKIFHGVAFPMLFLVLLLFFWKGVSQASSFAVGFFIIWGCYAYSIRRLASASDIKIWFSSLIRVVFMKWAAAFLLMSIVLLIGKSVPGLHISSLYVFAGFVCSVLLYRARVVFGEVRNV